MKLFRIALGLCVLTVSLSVVGCAPGSPEAGSTATATRASTSPAPATPTPSAPSAPVVQTVVVGVTNILVLDSSGATIADLSFGSPAADVAAQLTTLFGVAPTETDVAAGAESWPSHNYDWGGFIISDELTGTSPTQVLYWDYTVVSRTASVNGITIQTSQGTTVGQAANTFSFDDGPWGSWTNRGETCGSEVTYSPTGLFQNSVILMVCLDDTVGVVSSFTSPQPMQV